MDSFVYTFMIDLKNEFSLSKQEKVSKGMLFAFFLKKGLISTSQFVQFCEMVLKTAEESKSEEYKLFILGLLAYSIECCYESFIRDFELLCFVIKYSLFTLEREYVNMMLEFQIIELIQKISPGFNFLNLMKNKSAFCEHLIKAAKIRKSSGDFAGFQFLQEKMNESVSNLKKQVLKFEIKSTEIRNENNSDVLERFAQNPIENSLIKDQFHSDFYDLMNDESEFREQPQKKTVIFKQFKSEASEKNPCLILKNQKAKIVSRPIENKPKIYFSKS